MAAPIVAAFGRGARRRYRTAKNMRQAARYGKRGAQERGENMGSKMGVLIFHVSTPGDEIYPSCGMDRHLSVDSRSIFKCAKRTKITHVSAKKKRRQ